MPAETPLAGAVPMPVAYPPFSGLMKEVQPPDRGILSRTLINEDRLKGHRSAWPPLIGRAVHERRRNAPAPSPAPGLGERQPADRRRQPERRAVAGAVPNRPP